MSETPRPNAENEDMCVLIHALNNPLTAVLGYCQILLLDKELGTFQRDALERIEAQAQRCRTILKGQMKIKTG